jgi:hypothetical protein
VQFLRRHWRNIILLLAAAALSAYLLQNIVQQTFLQPLSYLWRQVNSLYRSVAQIVYWAFLLALVFGIAASSLLVRLPKTEQHKIKRRIERGPVEEMAWWISKSHSWRRSAYFKRGIRRSASPNWRCSSMSGRTCLAGCRRKNCSAEDESMPPDVQNYLTAGWTSSRLNLALWSAPPPPLRHGH